MRFLLLFIFLCALQGQVQAQQSVKGKVTDTQGNPLPRAVLKAYSLTSATKMIAYTLTDSKGEYELKLPQGTTQANVNCSYMGFEEQAAKVSADSKKDFRLKESNQQLKEVVVKAPSMRSHGDTLTYNVAQFKSGADRTLLDVIKKLPGITVETTGTIRYQNEPINKFYIEDMDMLGGRYNLATNNINPDDIASINVYENHQAQKVLKDFVMSDKAALNIKLKANRKSIPLGNLMLGAGWGDHMNYMAELFSMLIAANRQQITTAKTNDFGKSYALEMTDYLQENAGIKTMVSSAFGTESAGTADVPENRFNDNHSYAFSNNALYRISNDDQLRVNLSYMQQRSHFEQNNQIHYNGMNSLEHREDSHRKGTQHQVGITGQYERNAQSVYLRNQFQLKADLLRNEQQLETNNGNVNQHQRMDSYGLTNTLNLTTRRGNHMFQFYSLVSLSNSPKGFMEAEMEGANPLLQNMKGANFYTREQTSFTRVLNTYWHTGVQMRLEANYDWVKTNLDEYQPQLNAENQVQGYKADLRMAPFLEYKSGNRLEATLTVPVYYKAQRYTDKIEHLTFADNRPYLEANVDVSYKPAAGSSLNIMAGLSQTYGDMKSFIKNPVFLSYRMQQIWGSGKLSEGKMFMISPRYSYRNALLGNFLSISGQYIHGKNNLMTVSDVDASKESSTLVARDNTSNQWTGRLSASKKLMDLGMTLKLDANSTYLTSDMMRQQIAYQTRNMIYSVRGEMMNDYFQNKLHTDLSMSYTGRTVKMTANTQENKQTMGNWTGSMHVSYTPTDALELYADAYMYWTKQETGSFKRTNYLDGGIRWKRKTVEWELALKNLTDSRTYERYTYVGTDAYRYIYHLRPLEGLLSVKFKL